MEQDPLVYWTMCGPAESRITGRLNDLEMTAHLGDIRQPIVVIGGDHDEVAPAIPEALHRGIPHSEWGLDARASHLPNLEQPDAYSSLPSRFLAQVKSAAGSWL
jgi:pimeloyl-ACP methyl ester carboxylesterase